MLGGRLEGDGQKAPCGGDFTKSAKEKAEPALLHEGLARKANEAIFRVTPELIAKAFDRLAEATMRLAEATREACAAGQSHRVGEV